MDLNRFLEPEFDFSQLDPDDLKRMGNVLPGELESVIRNSRTALKNMPGWPLWEYFYFAVGISDRARCFFVLLKFENDKYCFKDIIFANESDIETFWCR